MISSSKSVTCFSKVLIAGGYSIIYEGNKGIILMLVSLLNGGLVLSTSANYKSVSKFEDSQGTLATDNVKTGKIDIESEGFNTTWSYEISLNAENNQLLLYQKGIANYEYRLFKRTW